MFMNYTNTQPVNCLCYNYRQYYSLWNIKPDWNFWSTLNYKVFHQWNIFYTFSRFIMQVACSLFFWQFINCNHTLISLSCHWPVIPLLFFTVITNNVIHKKLKWTAFWQLLSWYLVTILVNFYFTIDSTPHHRPVSGSHIGELLLCQPVLRNHTNMASTVWYIRSLVK